MQILRILRILKILDNHEFMVFTSLQGMQMRYGDEKAVRLSVSLSVRPSVYQTRAL